MFYQVDSIKLIGVFVLITCLQDNILKLQGKVTHQSLTSLSIPAIIFWVWGTSCCNGLRSANTGTLQIISLKVKTDYECNVYKNFHNSQWRQGKDKTSKGHGRCKRIRKSIVQLHRWIFHSSSSRLCCNLYFVSFSLSFCFVFLNFFP